MIITLVVKRKPSVTIALIEQVFKHYCMSIKREYKQY